MRISDWSSDVCSSDLKVLREPSLLISPESKPTAEVIAEPQTKHTKFKATREILVLGMAAISRNRRGSRHAKWPRGALPFHDHAPPNSLHTDGLASEVPKAVRPVETPTLHTIGRAHVRTPVTNSHLVCRLMHEKK